MPRKNKVAKKRLDKYYRLAKEQGYRSRAAFKLIQLNKKYNFLNQASTLLDLCAAPGGWLQVASKLMPVGSTIVGVDLVPIRSILNVKTFQADIMAKQCRLHLKNAFNHKKVEVVLHDGSPNVGTAWTQDAYSQSELTLAALSLAVEFMSLGATFITKVFRSADYNALLWVLNQFFKKVESTKPSASRDESAEIYVICRGFTAPKHIDPKLLQPNHVFKQLQLDKPAQFDKPEVFEKNGKRINRSGYEEGNYILYKKCSIADFIKSDTPLQILANYNKLEFDEKSKIYQAHPITTPSLIESCQDLKLLGKFAFKEILKWRLQIREIESEAKSRLQQALQKETPEEKPLTNEEIEEATNKELAEKIKESASRSKKRNKIIAKRRKQFIKKAAFNMNIDASDIAQDASTAEGLFQLQENTNSIIDKLPTSPDEIYETLEEKLVRKIAERTQRLKQEDKKNRAKIREAVQFDEDPQAAEYDEIVDDFLEKSYDIYLKEKKRIKNHKDELKQVGKSPSRFSFNFNLTRIAKPLTDYKPDLTRDPFDNDDPEADKYFQKKDSDDEYDADSDENENSWDSPLEFDDDEGMQKNQENQDNQEAKVLPFQINDKDSDAPLVESNRSALWFNQPLFNGLLDYESDFDLTLETLVDHKNRKRKNMTEEEVKPIKKQRQNDLKEFNQKTTEADDLVEDKAIPADIKALNPSKKELKKLDKELKVKRKTDKIDIEKDFNFVEVPQKSLDIQVPQEEDYEEPAESEYDSDEKKRILALGTAAVRQGKFSEIIDDAYNKNTWNDYNVPPLWFANHEKKATKVRLPVTKEIVQEIRDRFKEIDARPMKKVVEAKARKKEKIQKRLQRIRTRANSIAINPEISEREKLQQVRRLFSGNITRIKPESLYVVRRKFQAGSKSRYPNATGKRLKIVDPRLKKDKMAADRLQVKRFGKSKQKKDKPSKQKSKSKSRQSKQKSQPKKNYKSKNKK